MASGPGIKAAETAGFGGTAGSPGGLNPLKVPKGRSKWGYPMLKGVQRLNPMIDGIMEALDEDDGVVNSVYDSAVSGAKKLVGIKSVKPPYNPEQVRRRGR